MLDPAEDPTETAPAAVGYADHAQALDTVEATLDQVERAVAAVDDGTYGRCRRCGAPVPPAVLAADPLAEDCGAHQPVGS